MVFVDLWGWHQQWRKCSWDCHQRALP